MRKLALSILVIAAAGAVAVPASAQRGLNSLSAGPNADGVDNARRIEENKMRSLEVVRKAGLAALQAQDFPRAEQSFSKLLSFDPTTSDANYLMGLAQMGQKKWLEAKFSLEGAIKNEPKRPEPKARLGVAYIMINDMDGAAKQRADLASMAASCGNCTDAGRIAANLAMIDKVLAAIAPKAPTAG